MEVIATAPGAWLPMGAGLRVPSELLLGASESGERATSGEALGLRPGPELGTGLGIGLGLVTALTTAGLGAGEALVLPDSLQPHHHWLSRRQAKPAAQQ